MGTVGRVWEVNSEHLSNADLGWCPQGIPQWFTAQDDIHTIISAFNRPQIGIMGHQASSPGCRRISQVYCVAFLFIMTVHPVFADELRRVLVVSPYDSALPALVRVEAGIREELESELPNVEIYTEYLDIERFSNAQYAAQLAAFLHEKYAGRAIDVVIAMAPEGLDFLLQRRELLFPQSKLMFTRLTEDELKVWDVPPEIPGIVSRYDPAPTVDLALHLQPDARRLIILMGTTDAERHEAAVTPDRLKAFAHRLEITYWSNLAMADVSRAVGKLQTGTFVLDLGIRRDGAGRFFIPRDVDQKLAAIASVPFYAGYETVLGRGSTGGNMEDLRGEGRQTAHLAVLLMNGPGLGLRMVAPTRNLVDWRQLQRWGLSEANLPPGTIVRFRPPGLWEEHKWLAVGAAAALTVQALLIAALIIQARLRQRTQTVLEQQQQELAHLGRVSLLGELSGAIAHEINNPLGTILANAEAGMDLLVQKPANTDEVREILVDIAADSKRAGNVIQRLRALFKKADAHLELVDLNSIVADVLELAERRLLEDNVNVATKLATDLPAVRADPVQLKQVLLNLIVNACDAMTDNQPGARGLIIATSRDDKGFVQVSVNDRGSGIAANVKDHLFQPFVTTKSAGIGLGLSVCRSIIEAHGGRLWASNNPDSGATFSVALPIEAH
jgi:signal transduction histidine kinase